MKQETIIKKLKRYAKSLACMEQESILANERIDAEHYKNDRLAFEQAIKIIERSNT